MTMTPTHRSTVFGAILVLVAAGSWMAQAKAQSARNEDVLPALLTEVKGLRAAMEQMASGSTQAQLLVGRLQLQEGRVTSMIRRLDTVRDSLAGARTGYNQLAGSIQMLGQGEEAGDKSAEGLGGVLAGLKSQLAGAKANVDRLTAEELQLTADITSEQQRWIAINQRLDELERTLAKR
jgi:chromosome segregation ATPase